MARGICFAQDIMILRTGEEIKAKVQEVGTDQIKYYKYGTNSPIYVVNKKDVFVIKYENGEKDVFGEEKPKTKTPQVKTPEQMYWLGRLDAKTYYTGQHCGAGGTIAATIGLSGIAGLIPAIACSASEPRESNLNIPPSDYSNDINYLRGYKEEAHKIKRAKVWTCWGVGIALNLLTFLIITHASNN